MHVSAADRSMANLVQGIKTADKAVSRGDLGLSVILRASTILVSHKFSVQAGDREFTP